MEGERFLFVAHMFFFVSQITYICLLFLFALVLLPGFVDKEGNLNLRAIVHPPYTMMSRTLNMSRKSKHD